MVVRQGDPKHGTGEDRHGDKRKSARFASHAVHHQTDFVDGAMLFEQILKIVLGGLNREITYIQFLVF